MAKKILFVGAVMIIGAGLVWAGPIMNPGKWEIVTRTEMTGMPAQTMTHVQCITAEDQVPMSRDANQECQVTDIVYEGNTVSWKISCGGQGGKMTGTGTATYSGDTMEGTMDMTMTGGMNMKVKNIMNGRRIGDCGGAAPSSQGSPAEDTAGTTVADDMNDVGHAAKDEAKKSAVNEVRNSVRGAFKGLFK